MSWTLRRRSDGSENILVGLGAKFVPENGGLLPPCWVELLPHMREVLWVSHRIDLNQESKMDSCC